MRCEIILEQQMDDKKYKCKYCGKKIHKIGYEINNGYCGKCREVQDWKKTLGDLKDFKK
jgi:hypothetical protein